MNIKDSFVLDNYKFESFSELDKDSLEMIRKWRNETRIRQWMYNDKIISKKEHTDFVKKLKGDRNNFYWLVIDNKKNIVLGVIYFNDINYNYKSTYFGYYGNPNMINKGIGLIFDRLIIKLGFEKLGFHTIKAEIIEGNKVIKIHEKMGFRIEGKKRDYIFRDNKWKDLIMIGLLETEV